jgi:hypothetical protein
VQKENRIMRLHMLDMRKVLRDCKGANFTTDLQRAYPPEHVRLSDVKQLRGTRSRHHHRREGAADQQLTHQELGEQQQGQQQQQQLPQWQQAEEEAGEQTEQQEQQPASSTLHVTNPVNPASTVANPVAATGNPASGRQNLQP